MGDMGSYDDYADNSENATAKQDQVGIMGLLGDWITGNKTISFNDEEADYVTSNLVSRMARSFLYSVKTPMQLMGCWNAYILNFISLNGNVFWLILRIFFLPWKVEFPESGTEDFVSAIGHLDKRRDLDTLNLKDYAARAIDDWRQDDQKPLLNLTMMASKIAYENKLVIKNTVIFKWEMHFEECYNCWNDYRQEWSTQVIVICDKPVDARMILVAFRGTQPFEAEDWAEDFDYTFYTHKDGNFHGKLHVGFLEDLGLGNRRIHDTIKSNLLKKQSEYVYGEFTKISAYYVVREKLKSLLATNPNAEIVITGHSLGAALAIMLPTVFAIHGEDDLLNKVMGVYTYGQPRIGDDGMVKFMYPRLVSPNPKYFRVVYSFDVVPRLPFDDKFFAYRHYGVCFYYDSFFRKTVSMDEPDPNFFGVMFVIPMYATAVWELIRSFLMKYLYGAEYEEGWYSVLSRVMGLWLPGCSAHLPTNYIDSVRLGD